MQTPISFALEILLDCETIEEAHKKARRYIKVLEACGNQAARPQITMVPNPAYANGGAAMVPAQAPSTQRLLEQHGLAQVAPAPMAAPSRLPAAEIDKETGRPMVPTGNGSKGPRKW